MVCLLFLFVCWWVCLGFSSWQVGGGWGGSVSLLLWDKTIMVSDMTENSNWELLYFVNLLFFFVLFHFVCFYIIDNLFGPFAWMIGTCCWCKHVKCHRIFLEFQGTQVLILILVSCLAHQDHLNLCSGVECSSPHFSSISTSGELWCHCKQSKETTVLDKMGSHSWRYLRK